MSYYVSVGILLIFLAVYLRKGKKEKKEPKESFESHVCDHDGAGLVELSPGTLWHVTAKFKGNGPHWRRMIVFRPPKSQSLILLSPTAVPEDVMSAVESLGSVDYLIIPNPCHRTDSAVFKQRYLSAKVASPPGWVRKAVSEVVPVDMDVRELAQIFSESTKVVRIGGQVDPKEPEGDMEYAYEFRCHDGSWAYAVTDSLFNFPEKSFATWLFGNSGIEQECGPTIPRVGRIGKFFMHSKVTCAEFYREMAKRDDVSMILMAHGDVYLEDTQKAFREIANDLVG